MLEKKSKKSINEKQMKKSPNRKHLSSVIIIYAFTLWNTLNFNEFCKVDGHNDNHNHDSISRLRSWSSWCFCFVIIFLLSILSLLFPPQMIMAKLNNAVIKQHCCKKPTCYSTRYMCNTQFEPTNNMIVATKNWTSQKQKETKTTASQDPN